MGLKGDDWRRIFARRYTLALMLVAAVWTTSSIIQHRLINDERNRAEVIALAAEQAALSQRLAFLTSKLDLEAPGCTNTMVCADILATSEKMEAHHDILTGAIERPDLAAYLAPIQDIYAAGSTPFAAEVDAFLDASCQLARSALGPNVDKANLIKRIRNSGTTRLIQTHQLIVEVLEAEASRALQWAALMSIVSLVATLALLALISMRIFKPMAERLQTTLNQMEAAQEQAQAAAEAASRASKTRGQFLKTASHELKTPLNAIMGLAEVIRSGEKNVDALLAEMSHASDHLLSMLNIMLDSHKLDEGGLVIDNQPVDLGAELQTVANIAGDLCRRKALHFAVDFDLPESLSVATDGPRLRQICLTLLDNAVRFTPRGEVRFGARMRQVSDEKILELTVEDTGIGIETSRQEMIFDRDKNTQGGLGHSGIGLGLAFSKTVAELMGGRIELSSQVGEGTKISVDIPMADASAHGGPMHPQLQLPPRVLIVDDNLSNRMVADAMTTLLGGEATLAKDGQEAVDFCQCQSFDLILMDISMPIMDGVTATRQIRDSGGPNRNTPIVAVTAHVAQEDVGDLLAIGFSAVLHKPVRKTLLGQVFYRFTGHRPELEEPEDAWMKGEAT